jgi:hypothetical protein
MRGRMLMTRVCKTGQIRTAWAARDQIGALRIAAQFFNRSTATKTFQRGMNAYNHAQFYRQISKEPQEVRSLQCVWSNRAIIGPLPAWLQREWGDLFFFSSMIVFVCSTAAPGGAFSDVADRYASKHSSAVGCAQ